jgi:hypothetical protein
MQVLSIIFLLCSFIRESVSDRKNTVLSAEFFAEKIGNESRAYWRAAKFRGLVVGKSTYADMLRLLGKPKEKEVFRDRRRKAQEFWYTYEALDELHGQFTVVVNAINDRIISIISYPSNSSKQRVIAHFGKDYLITRYSFCPGFQESEAGRLFQSPKGNVIFLEYRSRGIAILISDTDVVNEIKYVARPIGFTSGRECR